MQELTSGINPDATQRDAWVCSWDGPYSSRKYYKNYFRGVVADEAFGWIWKCKCTMEIKVFAWLLLADRVNTKNMLKRRQYNITDGVECVLCTQQAEETVEHLFFECPFSGDCWRDLDSNGRTEATD